MPVKEARSEETRGARPRDHVGRLVRPQSRGEVAVHKEEKRGALYRLEPREKPFRDVGVNIRVCGTR
jgi:hypothetical protein